MIKSEKAMVEVLNANIRNLFGADLVLNEIRMAVGIPDVVFMEQFEINSECLTDYHCIKMMNKLPNVEELQYGELKKLIGFPDDLFKRTLKLLTEKKYIKRQGNSVCIMQKLYPPSFDVSSVEAKVKDWKNGLNQAVRYKSFTDYSYLAIHEDYAKNIDVDMVNANGLGVIQVKNNGESTLIVAAQKSQECNKLFKSLFVEKVKERLLRLNI
jgi:hypothetical protein